MNTASSKSLGFLTGWLGDGPWRSKTVLAALAVVVVGTVFWLSDVKKGPPQSETGGAVTDAPAFAPTDSAAAPAETRDWKKPFPWYAKVCASYVGGFCIGWFFRKLLRLVLVIAALAIALLMFGKYAGCDITRTREQVNRGSEWAQRETTVMKDYLRQLLPSATAGGIGTLLGFRRRGKTSDPKPAR